MKVKKNFTLTLLYGGALGDNIIEKFKRAMRKELKKNPKNSSKMQVVYKTKKLGTCFKVKDIEKKNINTT